MGGRQDVGERGLDVDGVTGLDVAGPDREAIGFEQSLDVAAEVVGLTRIPGVDLFALHAGGLEEAPVGVEDLAIQDQVWQAVGHGMVQSFTQVGRLGGEHVDRLVQVPVGKWPG